MLEQIGPNHGNCGEAVDTLWRTCGHAFRGAKKKNPASGSVFTAFCRWQSGYEGAPNKSLRIERGNALSGRAPTSAAMALHIAQVRALDASHYTE